jgi:hypothetical protein
MVALKFLIFQTIENNKTKFAEIVEENRSELRHATLCMEGLLSLRMKFCY